MKYLFSILNTVFLVSSACQPDTMKESKAHFLALDEIINKIESDLIPLEAEISQLATFSSSLFDKSDSWTGWEKSDKYVTDERGYFFNPNINNDESTVFVSLAAENKKQSIGEVYMTESMDEAFKEVLKNNPMVSQVFFNSTNHFSRLYPPYDLFNSLEPDIDITSFNFYYLADEVRNPTRKRVWVEEVYIDPFGRGWILSLIHPVYHENELKGVLGFDITLTDLMSAFLGKFDKNLIIVDSQGTIVAGGTSAIEALSMPPLKNHTYLQTISADNFRKEDFNLFKSKSKEVRRIISKFLLEKENYRNFEKEGNMIEVYCRQLNIMTWYLLDIHV
ncbi:MAG: PDC sensor domain-containing protein [Cyclobacteriaceae bacterium]